MGLEETREPLLGLLKKQIDDGVVDSTGLRYLLEAQLEAARNEAEARMN